MSLLKWNDNLSVKIAAMDKEHQKLIGLINDLNDAMGQGKGKDIIGKTLDGLLLYTKTHFADEEKMLTAHAYPELVKQKNMHVKFVEKVTEYKQKYESGNTALSIAVVDFLSNWLKSHIQVEDKKYGVYLNAKGVK